MERCGAIQEGWNVAGRCNASQDAQDAWDAENTSLASERNARGSDAGSVFADLGCRPDTHKQSRIRHNAPKEKTQTPRKVNAKCKLS